MNRKNICKYITLTVLLSFAFLAGNYINQKEKVSCGKTEIVTEDTDRSKPVRNMNKADDVCQTDHTEITYSRGYYYYKSQEDSFYLYRSDANGKDRECIVKQVPKEIYIRDEWIYFINLSDGSRMYRVRTDGSNMEMLLDKKTDRFLPVGTVFYCLTISENGENEIFSWSETDGITFLDRGDYDWLSTDGIHLYIRLKKKEGGDSGGQNQNTENTEILILDSNGNMECICEGISDVIPQGRYLYYTNPFKQLMCLDRENGETIFIADVLARGPETEEITDKTAYRNDWRGRFQADYYMNSGELYGRVITSDREHVRRCTVYRFDSQGKAWTELFTLDGLQGTALYEGISGFYIINGNVFTKVYAGKNRGERWNRTNILTGESGYLEEPGNTALLYVNGGDMGAGSREGEVEEDILLTEQYENNGFDIFLDVRLPVMGQAIPARDKISEKTKEEADAFRERLMREAECAENVFQEDKDTCRVVGKLYCEHAYADADYVSIVYSERIQLTDAEDSYEYPITDYIIRFYRAETGEEIGLEDMFDGSLDETLMRLSYEIRKTDKGIALLDRMDMPERHIHENTYYRSYYRLTEKGLDVWWWESLITDETHFTISYEELEDSMMTTYQESTERNK